MQGIAEKSCEKLSVVDSLIAATAMVHNLIALPVILRILNAAGQKYIIHGRIKNWSR